jgi:hypothetical protein
MDTAVALRGTPRRDIITSGASIVDYIRDNNYLNLQDSTRLKHSVDKRLNYVVRPSFPPFLLCGLCTAKARRGLLGLDARLDG